MSASPAGPSEAWLIQRYVSHRDLAARDALVARMMPLVRRISRAYHAQAHAEDLEQVAALGLVKAIERYDPAQGGDLRRYAIPTMLGEVRRYLRDHAWAMRVPRPLQERVLAVTKATERLTSDLGHAPTPFELAQDTGYDLEQVLEALTAGSAYRANSLDAPVGGAEDAWSLGETLGGDDPGLDRAEDRAVLRRLSAGLDERARRMLALRFVEDRTQTEIAAEIGCSQMQVSRVLRRAIADMEAVAVAA